MSEDAPMNMALPTSTFCGSIDRIALEQPDLPALKEPNDRGGRCISYGELSSASCVFAAALLGRGIEPNVARPIATKMRRGADWYIVFVATARLGTPLLGLSVDLRTAVAAELRRNLELVELTRPQLLVLDEPGEEEMPGVPFVSFKALLTPNEFVPAPMTFSSADDLLCYAQTGGTTGRRRCIRVTHRMAVFEVDKYPEALGVQFQSPPRVLQPSSLYWAAAVFGQLDLAVAFRGCAVVTEAIDAWELAAVIIEEHIGILGLPPSILSLLTPTQLGAQRPDGGSLRCLISWGEACPPGVALMWASPGLPWKFRDLLISTEYWLSLVASEFDADGRSTFAVVGGCAVIVRTLGLAENGAKGEAGTQPLVEAGDGQVGELCIGGPSVCPGFAALDSNADTDVASFVSTPDGRQFFCTGDLVVRCKAQFLFAGRGDEYVKVDGKWLDLGEIVRTLSQLPQVKEVASLVVGPSDFRLAIVGTDDLERDALQASVVAALPVVLVAGGQLLVQDLTPVGALPRHAATQKVDRTRLRELLVEAPVLQLSSPSYPSASQNSTCSYACILPSTSESASFESGGAVVVLCRAVGEALGLRNVCAGSSFLDLGGDSASAVRASAAAAREGVCIKAVTLLRSQSLLEASSTAMSLASIAQLETGLNTVRSLETKQIEKLPLWRRLLNHAASGYLSNYVSSRQPPSLRDLSCEECTAISGLESGTWSDLLAAATQNIGRGQLPPTSMEDICLCTPLQEVMLALLESEADGVEFAGSVGLLQSCFELRIGIDLPRFEAAWARAHYAHPALRTAFARIARRYWQVSVLPDVSGSPSWSYENLRGDDHGCLLEWLDQDARRGFDVTTPGLYRLAILRLAGRQFFVLTIHNAVCDAWSCSALLEDVLRSYIDNAAVCCRPTFSSVASHLKTRDSEAYATFWRNFMQNIAESPRVDGPSNVLPMEACRSLHVGWSSVKERALSMRVTPAALVHAAWALSWACLSGLDDVLVGTVFSGRECSNEAVLGMMLALLPLRVRIEGSVEHIVETTHQALLQLMDFQSCSLLEIREWSGLRRDRMMFDSVLIYENAPEIPANFLETVGCKPYLEREALMTAVGSVVELRIEKHGDDAVALKLRGSFRQNSPDATTAITVFDTVLSRIVSTSGSKQLSVAQLKTALPVLAHSPGRSLDCVADSCDYWASRLMAVDVVDNFDLPLDAPRRAGGRQLGCVHWSLQIDPPPGFSVVNVLLVGWVSLLSRLAGAKDLVVGIPLEVVSGGNVSISWYPLVCGLAGEDVVRRLVSDLNDFLKAACSPARPAPLRELLEFGLRREPCRLQALLGWADTEADASAAWSAAAEKETFVAMGAWALHSGSGMRGLLFYDGAVVDCGRAQRAAHSLEQILHELVRTLKPTEPFAQAGSAPLGQRRAEEWLAASSAKERVEALHRWGVEWSRPLPEVSIDELVWQQARRCPHSIAISASDATLTYWQLQALVESTSAVLRASKPPSVHQASTGSVGRGVVNDLAPTVGLLAERSALMLVAMLASLRADIAYTPLPPSAPAARLQTMVEIAKCFIIVAEPWLTDLARSLDRAPVIVPDLSLRSAFAINGTRNSVRFARDIQNPGGRRPERSMILLFTSGSTGVPKAVRLSGTAVLTHIMHVAGYNYRPFDVALQHTSPCWVASLPEIWAPLVVGATLACAPGGSLQASRDIESLSTHTRQTCSSLLQFVPSVLSSLQRSGIDPIGPACRHLVLTGEPLPTDLCADLLGVHRTAPPMLRNHYGQTEATDTTTVWTGALPLPPSVAAPVGRPAAYRHVWLQGAGGEGESSCDHGRIGESVGEFGGPGEIIVAGLGLLLGEPRSYPGLVPNARGAGSAFATGDVGRWTLAADAQVGELICLGRRDGQVKVRGHRVELAEIEAILRREASTLLRGSRVDAVVVLEIGGSGRLLAYLCPAEAAGPSQIPRLQAACKNILPAYMLPSAFIGVDAWPRTVTGKIIKRLLPPAPKALSSSAMDGAASCVSASGAPPVVVLCDSPAVEPARLRAKLVQLLRAALLGAVVARFQPLRAVCLPYAWLACVDALDFAGSYSSRCRIGRGVREELGERLPWLAFLVMSFLIPRWQLMVAAFAGVWRAGFWRAPGHSALWWGGFGLVEASLLSECAWYRWYLRPEGLPELARALLEVMRSAMELLRRGRQSDPPIFIPGWDKWQQRPKQGPRLEWIDVDAQPGPEDVNMDVERPTARREDLSQRAREFLAVIEAEAGRTLELSSPLASVFDSLRMLSLVTSLRRQASANLALRDILLLDTVLDLVEFGDQTQTDVKSSGSGAILQPVASSSSSSPLASAPSSSSIGASSQADSVHRIAEWRYMFRLSVVFGLASDAPVQLGALRAALAELRYKHESLRAELLDSPALVDIAMEAAGNLALFRRLLLPGDYIASGGKDGKGNVFCNHGLATAVARETCAWFGAALLRAWPRVAVRPPTAEVDRIDVVPLTVYDCEDDAELERRSEWLIDGRNASQFLKSPLQVVVLSVNDQSSGNQPRDYEDTCLSPASRIHIVLNHGFCDGFSGMPLLSDLQQMYERHLRARSSSAPAAPGACLKRPLAEVEEDDLGSAPSRPSDGSNSVHGAGLGMGTATAQAKRLRQSPTTSVQMEQQWNEVPSKIFPSSHASDGMTLQERRLACALLGPKSGRARSLGLQPSRSRSRSRGVHEPVARVHGDADDEDDDRRDLGSTAIPCVRNEAFDHFVWLSTSTLQTLGRVVEKWRWCCSLDIALLASLACALGRLPSLRRRNREALHLRLSVAMRDGPEEGSIVGDLADFRDLDVSPEPSASVQEVVRCIAGMLRRRAWRVPDPLADGSQRVFLNFRPLINDLGGSPGSALRHASVWPPTHGERGWDKRNIPFRMWIMADQVDLHEWVLQMKIQHARPGDAELGRALESVITDLALRPFVSWCPDTDSPKLDALA